MQGKVVLITGGAKRVGAAICRRLHGEGANLMIHYRSSAAEAEALRDELNRKRLDSVALAQADLHDVEQLPELVAATVKRFGRLDVLINNASSFYPTVVGEIGEKDWHDLLGTNLKAPLFLSQAAAHPLRHSHGCIVNITDIHAERPMKSYVVYSIAKAGLVALTKSLAHELGPEVRVNAVSPGPIMWPEDPTFDEQERRRIVAHTLLKREGSPDDIARAVLFLIKDAPYITGTILPVDGGRSASL
ncbi:MAG: pteridine reductase [Betaproteobacteria bacterium CG2_30_59_46]|nr:MAG: pteridine reductase [Betaproteobacteria bacterium CG2_30_59_46]PIQ12536.1 MAG: pteridine reductase [Hydrogenophilales bacterium CG18_big_fil_WC_8_21_14_2_50_58_12]PIX98549.1 MAG: pteridine reductase [Hydrogenophilales bacterium CG_4_10_14_3_um_filter_58_23]PJB03631.1 MAG: pteridine reductase [Hydrogenophilales bacterium CG_4_9_14_3_um_filter_59_35]